MFKFRFGTFETNSSSSHNLSCFRKFERKDYSFDDVLNKYEEVGLLKDGKLTLNLSYHCSDIIIENYDTPIKKLDAISTYIVQELCSTLDSIDIDSDDMNLFESEDAYFLDDRRWCGIRNIGGFIDKRHKYPFLFKENILKFFSELVDAIEKRYGKVDFTFNGETDPSLGIFEYEERNFLENATVEDIKSIIADDSVIIQVENTYYY